MRLAGRRSFLLGMAGAAGVAGQGNSWRPMFDGKSLAGWKEVSFPRHGRVEVRDGAIVLGRGAMTGISWGGSFPKTDYEIRFEAARLEGKDFFAAITFPVKESFCTWVCGGWDGTVVGLSNVDGYDASENETSTNRDFETGRWYEFRLAVTSKRIQAWIGASMVTDVDLTVSVVSLRFDDIDLCKPLGFASYATVGGIRMIEYRTITGSGGAV